jgi:hypothetical protein
MNIINLHKCLEPDAQRALEGLVIGAAGSTLDAFTDQISEIREAMAKGEPGDWTQTDLDCVLEDRCHLLELFGALADHGESFDYLVNWEVVDRVRTRRLEREAPSGGPTQEVTPTLPAPERILDFSRRRGRRPEYRWPDFFAEMTRHCMVAGPIANQAQLERHMTEWCATTWNKEPANSVIRSYVAPTFKAVQSIKPASGLPAAAADLSANAP